MPDDALRYVRKRRGEGASDDDVALELVRTGMTPEEAEEALLSAGRPRRKVRVPPARPVRRKTDYRMLVLGTGVLVCIAFITLGVIGLLQTDSVPAQNSTVQTQPVQAMPPGPPVVCDTWPCIEQAAVACHEANYTYTSTVDLLGTLVTSTRRLGILSPAGDLCNVRFTTLSETIAFSKSLRDRMRAQGKSAMEIQGALDSARANIPTAVQNGYGTCTIDGGKLAQSLAQWASGSGSVHDIAQYCTGPLFNYTG